MDTDGKALEEVATGAGIVLIGMFISKLISYFYRVIIARSLGPDNYGLFTLGLSVLGIVSSLAIFGFVNAILRYISYYKGKEDERSINGVVASSLQITLPLGIILGFLLFILSDKISIGLFHNPNLIPILKIFSFVVPLMVLKNYFEMIITAFQKIKYVVYSKHLGENLIKLILTILIIYFGYGLIGVTIVYLVAILISTLLLLYFLQKKVYNFFGAFKDYIPMKKDLLIYSLPLVLSGISILIISWTDTLTLGYFKDSVIVGIYNTVMPSAGLLYTIPIALTTLFFPVITELYSNGHPLKHLFRTVTKWAFFINVPIALLFIFFSKTFLRIFFGSIYSQGYLALIILSIAFFIHSLSMTSNNILLMLKKTKTILFNRVSSSVLNLVLNIIFIPRYGMIGAAGATGVAVIYETILLIGESTYALKVFPFKFNYIKSILCGLFAIFIVWKISGLIPINIFILIGLFAMFLVIYLVLILITCCIEKEDLYVLDIIRTKTGIDIGKLIRRFV